MLKEETYLISAVQQHPKYELINWKLQYPPLERWNLYVNFFLIIQEMENYANMYELD